jgi:hypothetical protein
MATVVIATGFEHGRGSTAGAGLCDLYNAATLPTTLPRTGLRSMLVDATTEYMGWTNTGPSYVARVYVNFAAWPSAASRTTICCVDAGTNDAGICVDPTGLAQIRAGTTNYGAGFQLTLDTWHRIDVYFNTTDTQLSVDGAAVQTGNPYTGSAVAFALGTYRLNTGTVGTMYVDDFALSNTGADFPLGAGYTLGFSPDRTGTHSLGSGVFRNNSAGSPDNSTDHNRIDEVPFTGVSSDFWEQQENDGAAYMEFGFAPSGQSDTIQLVRALVWLSADSTAGCACEARIVSGATETTVHTGTIGSTSGIYKGASVTPNSSPWTDGQLDALLLRFGYATDANPDPHIEGAILEVAFGVAGTTSEKTGVAVAGDVGSAVDVEGVERAKAGQAVAGAVSAAADVFAAAETGTAAAGAVSSGASVVPLAPGSYGYGDYGAGAYGGAAGATYEKAGKAAVGAAGSAADVLELTETGAVAAGAQGSAPDAVTVARTGQTVAGAGSSAADVAEHVEAATAAAGTLSSGASQKTVGGIEYVKAGTVAAGATSLSTGTVEFVEAGIVATGVVASGDPSAVYAEAGTATAGSGASAADVAEHAESGAVAAGALASGPGSALLSTTYQKTGAAVAGATASAGDAFTGSRTGQAAASTEASGDSTATYTQEGIVSTGAAGSADRAVTRAETGTLAAGTAATGQAATAAAGNVYAKAGTIAAGVAAAGVPLELIQLPPPLTRGTGRTLTIGTGGRTRVRNGGASA